MRGSRRGCALRGRRRYAKMIPRGHLEGGLDAIRRDGIRGIIMRRSPRVGRSAFGSFGRLETREKQRLSELFCQLGQKSFHCLVDRLLFELAFPYDMNTPAHLFQLGARAFVPLDIAFELHDPILDVCLGDAWLATRASMPKAPVDEQGHALSRPSDVGMPRNLPLKAVSRQTRSAESRAHQQFGFGVAPLVSLHGFSDRFADHAGHDSTAGGRWPHGSCRASVLFSRVSARLLAFLRPCGAAFCHRCFPMVCRLHGDCPRWLQRREQIHDASREDWYNASDWNR